MSRLDTCVERGRTALRAHMLSNIVIISARLDTTLDSLRATVFDGDATCALLFTSARLFRLLFTALFPALNHDFLRTSR
jgi:hypothetical protein